MSTLVEYRQAIVDKLTADATIASLSRTIQTHSGRVTLETLKFYARKTPAVLVTISSFAGNTKAGTAWADALVEVYILATLTREDSKRDELAMLLAGAITVLALEGSWSDIECIGRPKGLAGKNLYTDKGEKGGVALWGVSWKQAIAITNGVPDGLVPLEEFDIDYNIDGGAPQVDAEDLVELDQP